uniref:Tyr recombinase domain-containing protein n=1 Tax=Xenopus tropicalis TaxID=8364 RepID=A0A803KB74_XENTR
MGSPMSRRNGISLQHTTAEIHIESPRPQSGRSGRAYQPLALPASICVPPHTTHPSTTTQDKEGEGPYYTHSTLVATQSVVCRTNPDVSRTTLDTSNASRPTITGSSASTKCTQTKFDGLDVETSIWKQEGFSDQVIHTLISARKRSTSKVYHRIWKLFLAWSQTRSIPWQSCVSTHILEFLQDGVDKGLSTSALKVQTSALAALFHKQWATLPEVKTFFQALLKLHPPIKDPIPPWDLNLVLRALQKAPFEPMATVDLKFLSWKVAFLLAICSARRVLDLAALSYVPPWTIFHQDKAVLRTIPSHLPKVTSSFHLNQEIVLPSFCPNPKNTQEKQLHTLDAVRALKYYIHRTADFRHSDALFVLFGSNKKGLQASKRSLARWIVAAILESYKSVGQEAPITVKAHSTRKISASWALHNSASIDAIRKAATWSSLHTFAKFYRLDVLASAEATFGRKVLQAAVAHR